MSDLTLASDFLFEVLYFVSVLFSFAWCALWSLEKLASMSSAVSFTDPLFLGMGTRGKKKKKKNLRKKKMKSGLVFHVTWHSDVQFLNKEYIFFPCVCQIL